mgnify:CR=1 FL=1
MGNLAREDKPLEVFGAAEDRRAVGQRVGANAFKDAGAVVPVSYTHLTLPTIYPV